MATPQLLYPTVVDIKRIEQVKLPFTMSDFTFKELFPMREVNAAIVEWYQLDDFTGLMSPRGLDGVAPRVVPKPENRYEMEPGVYGNHMIVSEREITRRAQSQANLFTPVDVRDLVMIRSEQLMHLQVARMLKLSWDLLINGIFTYVNDTQAIVHRSQYQQTTFTATNLWSDATNSTPIADLRAVKLLARGKSTHFNGASKLYMNQTTFNYLVANRNAGDLYGIRTQGLSGSVQGMSVPTNLNKINEVLAGEDLPQIVIYDETYKDDAGVNQLLIPTGKAQLFGVRNSGAPLGNWTLTRNAWNPGQAPGSYYKIIQNERPGEPPLEIHRGFNGGIELHFPGSLVTMTVA